MTTPGATAERRVVRHAELLRAIRAGRLGGLRRAPLEIRVHDHGATAFREVVDVALALALHPGWTWVDAAGRAEAPKRLAPAVLHLAREAALSIPAAYVRHRRAIARLVRAPGALGADASPGRGVFLRTDHDFGLVAGGSVGHLAGVIAGLRAAGVALDVVSTDRLSGVPADERFHLLPPRYAPVRNLFELPEAEHTDRVVRHVLVHAGAWRPGFVYQRYSLNNYAGLRLRRALGIPFVCEYNGSFPWMVRHWEDRRLRFERLATAIEDANLRGADLLVVVSRGLAEEAAARGVDPARILVNPNGVDPDRYAPSVSGAEVRRRHSLGDRLVVGFIGTFGRWHGVEVLVEALARVLADPALPGELGERLHLLLIGDGLRMPEVRAAIERLGLAGRVTLTGQVPQQDGPAHLAACDLLASPHVPNPDGSRFFGSPTKLFEYMAMGRPIVASALEQIGEVLEHGRTAWLVPPGDAAALAAGLREVLADAGLAAGLGDAARRAALERHTWDAHACRILDTLGERLAAEPRRPPALRRSASAPPVTAGGPA